MDNKDKVHIDILDSVSIVHIESIELEVVDFVHLVEASKRMVKQVVDLVHLVEASKRMVKQVVDLVHLVEANKRMVKQVLEVVDLVRFVEPNKDKVKHL